MDLLDINALEVWTRIGVPAEERKAEQRVLVSISMHIHLAAAGKQDDVKKSINYQDVAENVRFLAKTERKTIEKLAEDIATIILKNYKPQSVTVTVKKFPSIGTRSVLVTITRP